MKLKKGAASLSLLSLSGDGSDGGAAIFISGT
jgi:hypothetical protein